MASTGARRRLSKDALSQLHRVRLSDRVVSVSFGPGPLGLQILHVPSKGVLVWHLDGQALAPGTLRIGAQVVAVGKNSCEGLGMEGVFGLVKKEPRPVVMQFRLPEEEAAVAEAAESIKAAAGPDAQSTEPKATAAPVKTKMRLEQIDRGVSSRLRKLSDGGAPPATVSGVRASRGRGGETVSVVFKEGPLGLQISDVGKRVLVTSFENEADGSPGQAERSGLVHFGNQVVRVGKTDCEGMSMHQVGMLVAKHKRPVAIEFRRLYERATTTPRAQKKVKAPEAVPASQAAPADPADEAPAAEAAAAPAAAADDAPPSGTETLEMLDHCTCSPPRPARPEQQLEDDPMYFHFQLLCKSAQIKILLDYEESAMQGGGAPFELGMLSTPELYNEVQTEGVVFCDWHSWIRNKYIEAYVAEQREERRRTSSAAAAAEAAAANGGSDGPHNGDGSAGAADGASEGAEDPVAQGDGREAQRAAAEEEDAAAAAAAAAEAEQKQEQEQGGQGDAGAVDDATACADAGPMCSFCVAKDALRRDGERLQDDMYIHFNLLFRGVKIQAETESARIDQRAYVEYLDNIDVEKLYQSCQEDLISMHQWQDWIKKQCIWGYENELFKISLSGDTELDLRDMIQENRNI